MKKRVKSQFALLSFFLGFLLGIFWILDAYVKIAQLHAPYRLFWYCSLGLLLTFIALIFRNKFLITSMICSLLLIEGVWYVSFILSLFHLDFLGMATYQLNATDFKIVNGYHLLLFPTLVYLLFRIKTPSRLGWLGAFIFTIIAGLGALLFVQGKDNVNCVLNDQTCGKFFSVLYNVDNPYRIFVGSATMTLIIFLPFNKLITFLKSDRHLILWRKYFLFLPN